MWLVWRYADASGNPLWRGLTWGMVRICRAIALIMLNMYTRRTFFHALTAAAARSEVPLLGGAMSACTWHFFYNAPSLEWLVTLQSSLTFLGNCTCWWAAYRIYAGAKAEAAAAAEASQGPE